MQSVTLIIDKRPELSAKYKKLLNNEDGTVYGFEEVYRGLKDLKTDGTYLASGGASSNGILRDKFEKNKRI